MSSNYWQTKLRGGRVLKDYYFHYTCKKKLSLQRNLVVEQIVKDRVVYKCVSQRFATEIFRSTKIVFSRNPKFMIDMHRNFQSGILWNPLSKPEHIVLPLIHG